MQSTLSGFECVGLDGKFGILVGRLPEELRFSAAAFEELWRLIPAHQHRVAMCGRQIALPRFLRAFGPDRHYSVPVNAPEPVPAILEPLLGWGRQQIEPGLNSVLLNFYDADRKHRIAAHRDRTNGMVAGTPIVTISLGSGRVFRLRPWRGRGFKDVPVTDGTVLVIPYQTNLAWTHEVPHRATDFGRRISVTLRAFREG